MTNEIKTVTAYEVEGEVYKTLKEAERAKMKSDMDNAFENYYTFGEYKFDSVFELLASIESAGYAITKKEKA